MIIDKILNLIGSNSEPKDYILDGKYMNEYLIVGSAYECRLNKKVMRQSIIKKSKVGDFVTLKPFKYKSQIGYAVVSNRLHLDLGTLSQGAAEHLASNKGAEYVGILTEKYDDTFHVKIYMKEA